MLNAKIGIEVEFTGITRTKVTSTTAHLFCTRDGMGRIRKRKQKKKTNPPPWKHNEYICLPLCPCQIKCARHIWP